MNTSTSSEDGSEFGFDENFDPPVDQRFICSICLAALRDPVQIVCGHRFCYSCLMRTAGNNPTVTCPFHKDDFDPITQIFYDNAMKREVLSLIVKCPMDEDGCCWKGELRDLKAHKKACPMAQRNCPMCRKAFRQSELESHFIDCPKRIELCPHCTSEVVFEELFKHQVLLCAKFPVSCALCGKENLLREEIPKHVSPNSGDCPQVIVQCPFNNFGCIFNDRRCKLDHHLALAAPVHTGILAARLQSLEKRLEEHETLLEKMNIMSLESTTAKENMERTVETMLIQLNAQSQRLDDMEAMNHTGVLLWMVDLENLTMNSTSPTFYTGNPGYAMSLAIQTHSSVHNSQRHQLLFTICSNHGKYDSQLNFPTSLQCKLRIFSHTIHMTEDTPCKDFCASVQCDNVERPKSQVPVSIGSLAVVDLEDLKKWDLVKEQHIHLHCQVISCAM